MSAGLFSQLDQVLSELGGYPVLAWMSNSSGICIDGNDTLFAYNSVQESQVAAINWLEMLSPEYRDEVKLAWTADTAEGGFHNSQVRLVWDEGPTPLWDLLGIPEEHPEHGTLWLFVAAPIQVYPAVVEEEHKRQLTEFRETMDEVNLLAFYYSAFGSIRYINKRLGQVFNLSEDAPERLGVGGAGDGPATQLRYVPPADRRNSIATWIYSMKTGSPHEVEYRLLNEDGTAKWFQIRVEPVMDRQVSEFFAGRILH